MILGKVKYLIIILSGVIIGGCSPLTVGQMQAAGELTFRTDTIVRSPQVLLSELAEIRKERGLLLAASITAPELHLEELNAIAAGVDKDRTDINQSGVYVQVLQSYLRALRSLSLEDRREAAGVQFRGIGREIETIIGEYNALDTGLGDIPEGYASLAGDVSGAISRAVMTSVQGKLLKETVIAADTLVGATCDSLIAILRSDKMNDLIENEREALEDNYLALLARMENGGFRPSVALDRKYVELKLKAENINDIRNSCVSALRSLKNAHRKLALNYAEKADREEALPDDLLDDIREVKRIAYKIAELW